MRTFLFVVSLAAMTAEAVYLPGDVFRGLSADALRKGESEAAQAKWKGPLTDEVFAKLAQATDGRVPLGTDAQLATGVPSSISPYARIKDVPYPEIRPFAHWTGHFTKDQQDSYSGLLGTCPFCLSRAMKVEFDPKDPEHAWTSCCRKDLWRRGAPANYDLKPDATADFRYLDDRTHMLPCKLYKDREGRTWELFVDNLFNKRDWDENLRTLSRICTWYLRTGNPIYPYKAAVILDRMAESYYAFPLALNNLVAYGADGKTPLSRAEWEALPRPNIWIEMPKIGWWNRGNPTFARGWFALGREGMVIYYYALLHHHPAFRYYSKVKYGDERRLDELVSRKLAHEINLGYESVSMNGLTQNYQAANSTPMLASAVIGGDADLIDFAAACHDCIAVNHHYSDGINGEGSVHYQGILRRQFYPHMLEANGWCGMDPGFHERYPFFRSCTEESQKQMSCRGRIFEHGDTYEMLRVEPNDRVLGDLCTNDVPKFADLPSRVWPNWGLGVLRVGAPSERLEVVLNFSRPVGHGGQEMGLAAWFDGFPCLRPHGYACPWDNADPDMVEEINQLDFPHKAIYAQKSAPNVHETWTRRLAQSAKGQNAWSLDGETHPKHRLSEPVAFKGTGKVQYLAVRHPYGRRALVAVETPSGRAYALDFAAMEGGRSRSLWYSVWGERGKDGDHAVDYFAYCRDGDGRPCDRPREGFGKVTFRVAPVAVEGERAELSNCPWSPLTNSMQSRPGGKGTFRIKTVTFENAMAVTEFRGEQPKASVFTTLLEGRRPSASRVVRAVSASDTSEGRVAVVELAEGGRDTVVWRSDGLFSFKRADPEGRVTLTVESTTDHGTIAALHGDLTGESAKSEIVVRPEGTWHADRTTDGLLLYAQTRANGRAANDEGFRVAQETHEADGGVRFCLEGPAPFVIGWHQLFRKDGVWKTNRPIGKFDQLDYYAGLTMTFPRLKKSFVVASTASDRVAATEDLAAAGVRNGDWFCFSGIAVGQRVAVPRFTERISK